MSLYYFFAWPSWGPRGGVNDLVGATHADDVEAVRQKIRQAYQGCPVETGLELVTHYQITDAVLKVLDSGAVRVVFGDDGREHMDVQLTSEMSA